MVRVVLAWSFMDKESKSPQPSGMDKNSGGEERRKITGKRNRKGIPRRSPAGYDGEIFSECSPQLPFEAVPDQDVAGYNEEILIPECSPQMPSESVSDQGQSDVVTGGNCVPQIVYVHPGEDIISQATLFVQKYRRDVCILSAIGVVSHAHIRFCGQMSVYEGSYEIVSLKGYVTPAIVRGDSTGNSVFVTLAKADHSVFDGTADLLVAASPVQLVLWCFDLSSETLPFWGSKQWRTHLTGGLHEG